jgi:hypothetical protein
MKNGYLSVDLETTGLEVSDSQIIQFGAVFDDLVTPIDRLPKLELIVLDEDDCYTGGSFAFNLNREIMRKISEATTWARHNPSLPAGFCYLGQLADIAQQWLMEEADFNPAKDRVTYAGKNFESFDARFLEELDFFEKLPRRHRSLDIGSMFWVPGMDGGTPPGSEKCLIRAGFDGSVKHEALDDALNVVKCIRAKHPTIGQAA